jgi:ferredoxin--NADP+ reductase
MRDIKYNATVESIREVRPWLRIFRLQPDFGRIRFVPGQYTVLGLGNWEPCVAGTRPQPMDRTERLVQRAYSFSCCILDVDGKLVAAGDEELLEFYIVLASGTAEHPAGLTPRLFHLRTGDRLFVGPRAKGTYTLSPVGTSDDVVFASTGTGEAPHNAMLARLLSQNHQGRVLSVVGARECADLAYESVHRELERRYSNYQYVTLTTREPRNSESTRADFVGKQYVQQFFAAGDWETLWGPIDPSKTHVFACGNPSMIGIPHVDSEGHRLYPEPTGLVEVLESRGFHADAPRQAGNIHFEKFW